MSDLSANWKDMRAKFLERTKSKSNASQTSELSLRSEEAPVLCLEEPLPPAGDAKKQTLDLFREYIDLRSQEVCCKNRACGFLPFLLVVLGEELTPRRPLQLFSCYQFQYPQKQTWFLDLI